MKRILITGKNSYIGKNFQEWLAQYPEEYEVEAISVRGEEWKEKDFSKYDSILHLAGLAHVSTNPNMEEKYYQVNRDLTIAIAEKAKKERVKQFIFMSSIIIYGDSLLEDGVIKRDTIPVPSNFYGNSKLQAEQKIEVLETSEFKISIIRPPMVYGRGSKGNYPKLAKLAKVTPIFPDFSNRRSMIHINNLCQFIKLIIDNNESGVFYPQNLEYVSSKELVKIIASLNNNKVFFIKLFNPVIKMLLGMRVIDKVFGNLVYEKKISGYNKGKYQVISFEKSIEITEGSSLNKGELK